MCYVNKRIWSKLVCLHNWWLNFGHLYQTWPNRHLHISQPITLRRFVQHAQRCDWLMYCVFLGIHFVLVYFSSLCWWQVCKTLWTASLSLQTFFLWCESVACAGFCKNIVAVECDRCKTGFLIFLRPSAANKAGRALALPTFDASFLCTTNFAC